MSNVDLPENRLGPDGLPLWTERKILRFAHESVSETVDRVVTEYALTVFVNDKELATLVCTPDYVEDLVIGFLASEGVIRSLDQVQSVTVSKHAGTARVTTAHPINFNQDFYNKRYIASCCGKSRQSFYFYNDAHTAKYVEDKLVISPSTVFSAMNQLEASAELWRETGGVHIASLYHPENGESCCRVDIGRHNALDKIYGHVLRNDTSTQGRLIAFSGRLSSEVLLKVAKIGVAVVAAKSAPTALALETADELNITTIGFVRNQGFNVYTHPWRLSRE